MPYEEGRPSVMGFFGEIMLRQVLGAQFLKEKTIRLINYVDILLSQYENGAIIGRARCNKLGILAKMLVVDEAKVNNFIKGMRDMAEKTLDRFRKEVGREPESLTEIIHREIESTYGISMTDYVLAMTKGNKREKKIFNRKVLIEKSSIGPQMSWLEGLGFGSSFPELTEEMYRNDFENIDMDVWSKVRVAGLDIDEKPVVVSLEDREEGLLKVLAGYTAEYYPELLDPLDLRGYIDTEGSH